jgi:hypothetical protein
MLLGLKRISAAFGLLALGASIASAQAPAMSQNQATANAVASALKTSRSLSAYRIEIETNNGVVTLAGSVSNGTQKREALVLASKVAGVSSVVDQIQVVDARVRQAQYPQQVAMGNHFGHGGSAAPMYEGAMTSAPVAAPDGSPVPEGPAAMGVPTGAGPNQPNYAWPSYAPTGNFSAVGYPTAYPWQAWPNIGPFYPYPEVPQDWRAVTLRWDDGIWWLDFKKHYTRPFFTPYPFGIFSY